MKKIIFILAITFSTLYSCVDPYAADSTFVVDTSALPAASYMEQTDSLNLSMWVELLKYTDLFNTMNLAANYTCFVPNNDAVKAYLAKKGVANITDLSIDEAKTLVKYHIIKGNNKYSAVMFDEGMIPDTTATGDYLSTSFAENGGTVRINLEATIMKTVNTNNAYIHILNAVLTPVTETIWEKLQSPNFSIFRQAVEASGFKDKLNTVSITTNFIQLKYRFTLFAVPDSIYKTYNINSFTSLVDSLKADSVRNKIVFAPTTNAVNQYVGYHLFDRQLSYLSLATFTDTKRSTNYATLAINQSLNISEVNKVLYINYNTSIKNGITFLDLNRNCKNGVVHVVNGLMTIKPAVKTTVQWELTDYSVMQSISKYKVTGLTSTYVYPLSQSTFICYSWLSVPEFRTNPVSYVVAKTSDTEAYKAANKDYLRLYLGKFGWIEMNTPTILAGSYTITVGHFLTKATAAQGSLKIFIDGDEAGTISTQLVTFTDGTFDKNGTTTCSVNQYHVSNLFLADKKPKVFSSTTTHKVKILAADDFSSDIDYIKFTPVP